MDREPSPSRAPEKPVRSKRQYIERHGWVILNKPYGMGSTTAVTRVRHLLSVKKAGHAGTLDPLATGVLPIAIGEATKMIPFIQDHIKAYRFTVAWGIETTTLDKEGAVIKESPIRPTATEIHAILPQFLGTIQQTPPLYSALKIDGKRAYDIARAGETVDMPARNIYIQALTLEAAYPNHADFEVVCGKGTYVRSLARDIAGAVGTVAHVTALHRSQVGSFQDQKAISLETLEELIHKGTELAVEDPKLGLDDIPAVILEDVQLTRLCQGQRLKLAAHQYPSISLQEEILDPCFVRCFNEAGHFKGIGRWDQEAQVLRPHRLLNL